MANQSDSLHGGHILKSNRERIGLTQEEVCLMANVSRRTYQSWESKKSEPRFGQVVRVCECAFKVDIKAAVIIATETPEQ